MHEELQQRVYSNSTASTSAFTLSSPNKKGSSPNSKEVPGSSRKAAVAAGLRSVAERHAANAGKGTRYGIIGGAGDGLGGVASGGSFLGGIGPLGLRSGGSGGAGGSFLKQMRSEASAVGLKLAQAGAATRTPGKMTALQGVSGEAAGGGVGGVGRYDPVAAMAVSARQIVRCLAHLDGVSEAKALFRYHSRSEVRDFK